MSHVTSERDRIAARTRIREVVFGAQDGALTTISVVSTFYGATHTNADILLAGMASGFAGMIAMSAGSYLSTAAETDVEKSEIQREADQIATRPAHEMAELVEIYRRHGMRPRQAQEAARTVFADPEKLLQVMAHEELGLDVRPHENPLKNAAVMGLSFLSGTLLPILPYVVLRGVTAFSASLALAALVLFGIGVVKAKVADTGIWRSGAQTFVIGTIAGLLGYVLGTLVPRYLGLRFSAP